MLSDSVSQSLFCSQTPFGYEKYPWILNILAHTNVVSGWEVSRIRYLYLRTDFTYVRIYASSTCNNALYGFTSEGFSFPSCVQEVP